MPDGPVLRETHVWRWNESLPYVWHRQEGDRRRLQKLRAYQYKPTAGWRHSVNVTYFENQGTRSAC